MPGTHVVKSFALLFTLQKKNIGYGHDAKQHFFKMGILFVFTKTRSFPEEKLNNLFYSIISMSYFHLKQNRTICINKNTPVYLPA